jgi:hypothetical protein
MGELGPSMTLVSHSQAGQDRFVYALSEGRSQGTFLDVGCSDPMKLSNTYALEQLGWTGVLIDCAPELAPRIAEKRQSPFVCGKAENIVWPTVLKRLPSIVDYLSFDVDGSAVAVFQAFPWSRVRFRILTVEHDAYRFGDAPRRVMRAGLAAQGYDLLCPDVMNDGCAFEDWWVDPLLVDTAIAARFRTTEAIDWHVIVSR